MTQLQAARVLLPLLAAAVGAGNFESFGDFGGERGMTLIPDLDAQFDSSGAFRGRQPAVSGVADLGSSVFPPPAAAAPVRRPVVQAPAPRPLPVAYAAAPVAVHYYPVPQAVAPQQASLAAVVAPAVFRSAAAAPRPQARPRGPAPIFEAQPAAAYRGHAVPAPAAAPGVTSYQVQHDRPLASPPRARLSGAYAPVAAAAPTRGLVSRAPAHTASSGRARYDDEDIQGFDFGGQGFGFGADDSF
ncbi:translation initiation factor IF-2-like [Schistocerca serialis cubense]|uniref:translation initiation factor IF-2-like n=1 Tax=Schistocerca serialis cubense TaxID=2023355 RepID=UPI00214DF0FE|nr:translation initiation factor IF-2-like [Schistocerca serialis cubense]